MKIKTIVDKIQDNYASQGLPAFSDDFFNMADTDNPQFNNLYLWLHRKKGNVEPALQVQSYATQVGGFYTNIWWQ